jgi:hypothetical protein
VTSVDAREDDAGCKFRLVEPERQELIARIDAVNDKLASTARTVEGAQQINATFRENLLRGEPLRDILQALTVPDELSKMASVLKELEYERHQARTAAFALGLAEGLSIGELGRLYGISRQLAQRFAKEAREDHN